MERGGIVVKSFLQHHGHDLAKKAPGFSAAFRIETPRGAIVIATDHEIGEDPEYIRAFADFISGAKILYHDMQYRRFEFDGTAAICSGKPAARKGWGHSTPDMLYQALCRCKEPVKQVILGHHDPERDVLDLTMFEEEVVTHFGPLGQKTAFAREGKYYAL